MRGSARASKRHLLHRASGSFRLEGSAKSRRSGRIDSNGSRGSNDVIYDVWPKDLLVLLLGRGILLLIVRLD